MTDEELDAKLRKLDRELDDLSETMLILNKHRKDDIAELHRLIGVKPKRPIDE